jgi:hypothetical protein
MNIYQEIDYIVSELAKLKNIITERETEINTLERMFSRGEISQTYYHNFSNLKKRHDMMETRLYNLRLILG